MAFTIIWLFTIYFSPIVESLSTDYCQRLRCTNYLEQQTCVEINGVGQPFYMAMSKCAAEEFMCLQGAAVKSKFVEVSKCSEKERRANRVLRLELHATTHPGSMRNFTEEPRVHPMCPKSCSSAQGMVCMRINNSMYRYFLNLCFARMHKCMYPKEKMELVPRRLCLGLVPYPDNATSLHGSKIEASHKDFLDNKYDPVNQSIEVRKEENWFGKHITSRISSQAVKVEANTSLY